MYYEHPSLQRLRGSIRVISLLTFGVATVTLLACSAGRGIQPEEREQPVTVLVHAERDLCYRAISDVLVRYGFPIESTDPILGIIRTGFIKYDAGAKGFWASVLAGAEDFQMQINAKLDSVAPDTSKLTFYGKMKYKQSESIFRSSEKTETIRAGSDSYKQMEQIAAEIKEQAEGGN